jgi:hypothetical protein
MTDENETTIKDMYRVNVPFGEGTIVVYGAPDMGWYEWRVVTPDGRTLRDTTDMCYGCPEIALRDALIAMTADL